MRGLGGCGDLRVQILTSWGQYSLPTVLKGELEVLGTVPSLLAERENVSGSLLCPRFPFQRLLYQWRTQLARKPSGCQDEMP